MDDALTRACGNAHPSQQLVYAEGVSNPTAASERLQRVFGEDFPVPKKKETVVTHPPAISSSGKSA